MTEGGGFCELHGPFDPPHTTCPYCALESEQRQVFGPPEATRPAAQPGDLPEQAAEPPAREGDFVRQTVEQGVTKNADVTEIAPRDSALMEVLEQDSGASDPAALPLGWLIVKEPLDRRGMVLPVRPNQTIGRQADVTWDDPRVSRQHARVTLERAEDAGAAPDAQAEFHIWPFGPANLVYVNGEVIRGATPIRENDEITLGSTVFVFKVLFA